MAWKRYKGRAELTPEQIVQRDMLVAEWSARYPGMPPAKRSTLYGAATRQVLHGGLPGARARLGLRTAKRRREWAAMFPNMPYPGRSGVRAANLVPSSPTITPKTR